MGFDANTVRRDYGDPELEAYACRTDCALFDYAFICRARLNGPGALDASGALTRSPLAGLAARTNPLRAARGFERPRALGSDRLEARRGLLRSDERPVRGHPRSRSYRSTWLRCRRLERSHVDLRGAGTGLAPSPCGPSGCARAFEARLFHL